MHDLRLVGVHEDGEHLMLSDAEGVRFSLRIDDAVRAAVRRDRSHLGQLQIQIEGGLRPREVQARIRAGATAEEVATLAGWTVEKVGRYEGPVLAERGHVAELARAVRIRKRGSETLTLGALVTQRLADRGVDAARVGWDAWRPDTGPWVVSATFVAGGREREARWHFDVAGAHVTAADDEARWLSEDEPAPAGPLGASRPATSTPRAGVYDIEADGGVTAEPRRDLDGGPFDLVGAMRSRRRERDAAPRPATRRRPGQPGGRVESTGDRPSDVPGSMHPAGRGRVQPEPLELDPTLMDDPPAAHPPASVVEARTPPTQRPSDEPELPADLVDLLVPGASDVGRVETPDVVGESDDDLPVAVGDPVDEPDLVIDVEVDPTDVGDDGPVVDEVEPADQPDAVEQPAPVRPPAPAARRGRRASVPSWDDIMFGARKE